MRRLASHPARIAALMVVLSVVLTGCFQPVGQPLLPTQPSNSQNPPPFTPLAATDVAILPTTEPPPATQELFPPTAQLPSPVPTTRVAPTRAPSATPTETPFPTLEVVPTETLFPSETPFIFPSIEPTATETPFELPLVVTETPTPTLTASPTETATETPQATATPTLFIPTAIAMQPDLQATLDAQGTLDAQNAQATQIIGIITATAAANATATSVALGTPLAPPDGGIPLTPIAPIVPPTAGPTGFPPNWLIPTDGAQGTIDEACIYTVVQGDRLIRIALRFNTGIRALARLNGIVNVDLISINQRLRIPCSITTPEQPDLPPGVTPTPLPVVNGYRVYIVQQGDNLFRLSLRYGVPIRTIAALNGIYNIHLIYVGQRLLIP